MLRKLLFAVLLLISLAAQAAVYSLPWGPRPQFVDANGAPMSSGTLSFFAAGTTTPQNTFTDSTGGVANSNPITLNVRGETPNEVWLTGGLGYKMVLKDSAGATVWTVDNISGVNDVTSQLGLEWIASGLTPTFVSATSFTVTGDQTLILHIGRRLKTVNSGGTLYSTITNSVFGAVTTVTVSNDAATLDSGLSSVSYAVISNAKTSIPSFQAKGDLLTQGTPGTLSRLAVGTGGQKLYSRSSATTGLQWETDTYPGKLTNVGLSVTMAANAVTIALKDASGADPSATSPVTVGFRSATVTSGASSEVTITAATSGTIASGATLGTTNAVASRIWIALINNAGTAELAWFNAGGTIDGYPIDEGALVSTTAAGGASNSLNVWYSTSARSSVPIVVIGYFDSTQATAGTWATSAADLVVNPRTIPTYSTVLGAEVATTSGTSVTLATGLPTGLNEFTVNFNGVSTNGTTGVLIQLGTSGGFVTANYQSSGGTGATGNVWSVTDSTAGFILPFNNAASTLNGNVRCTRIFGGNTWTCSGMTTASTGVATTMWVTAGKIASASLGGVLDRIRLISTNSTDTFDAGGASVNARY